MEASHKRYRPHIKVGKKRKKNNVVLYILRLIIRASKGNINFTLYLGPPVPLGASGDETPPSITVTGDPAA